MGRNASTISRELRRNSLPRGEYKPASADRIALSRRRRLSKIERLSRLRDHVCDHLAMGWSPEQIAGRLRLEGSEHEISHESIYRFIYRPKVRKEKLHRFLARVTDVRSVHRNGARVASAPLPCIGPCGDAGTATPPSSETDTPCQSRRSTCRPWHCRRLRRCVRRRVRPTRFEEREKCQQH